MHRCCVLCEGQPKAFLFHTCLWFWGNYSHLKIHNLIMHLQRREAIWEQELYNTFEYKEQRSFFHIFEADVSNIFPSTYLEVYFYLIILPELHGRPKLFKRQRGSSFCRHGHRKATKSSCTFTRLDFSEQNCNFNILLFVFCRKEK